MEKEVRRKPLGGLDVTGKSEEYPVEQEGMVLRDEHFQTVAFLAKSLSDENRPRIILCVSNGKKSVSSIVEEPSLSQPLVSHHLKELKRSLQVKIERSGPFIYYELVDDRNIDINPGELAEKLWISLMDSTFLLSKLKREGKL